MPKQGLQMTEGTIIKWLAAEGGQAVEGQPLFEMETDKLTITIDASVSGTLLKILASEGATVPITATIAVVGSPGEDISAIFASAGPEGEFSANSVPSAEPPQGPRLPPPESAAGNPAGGRVFISPRAKMRAEELGVDYKTLAGSAADGMIVERDILAARPVSPVSASPLAKKTAALSGVDLARIRGSGIRGKIMRDDVERARSGGGGRIIVPLKGMRKIIADRMKRSQNENAQTCHRISVRMDEAVRLRLALDKKAGYNDLIALSTVRALRDFPAMNAELVAEGIWQKDFVNLGIAVAVDNGLLVPVVKDADLLSFVDLAAAIKDLAERARSGVLQPDDYSGGTFTISNLGMFGLDEFTAIINPPEAGILAVGRIEDVPVAVSGSVEIHPVMKLTLSYDHRVVDGAPAAQFLSGIKEYLENPFKLL
jgi:pyruvate dehydrogenase E2 component (dihydrolipoamide acetyltransferase)